MHSYLQRNLSSSLAKKCSAAVTLTTTGSASEEDTDVCYILAGYSSTCLCWGTGMWSLARGPSASAIFQSSPTTLFDCIWVNAPLLNWGEGAPLCVCVCDQQCGMHLLSENTPTMMLGQVFAITFCCLIAVHQQCVWLHPNTQMGVNASATMTTWMLGMKMISSSDSCVVQTFVTGIRVYSHAIKSERCIAGLLDKC